MNRTVKECALILLKQQGNCTHTIVIGCLGTDDCPLKSVCDPENENRHKGRLTKIVEYIREHKEDFIDEVLDEYL
jgi:hypothetical protein